MYECMYVCVYIDWLDHGHLRLKLSKMKDIYGTYK